MTLPPSRHDQRAHNKYIVNFLRHQWRYQLPYMIIERIINILKKYIVNFLRHRDTTSFRTLSSRIINTTQWLFWSLIVEKYNCLLSQSINIINYIILHIFLNWFRKYLFVSNFLLMRFAETFSSFLNKSFLDYSYRQAFSLF